jgi:hypothetical protein
MTGHLLSTKAVHLEASASILKSRTISMQYVFVFRFAKSGGCREVNNWVPEQEDSNHSSGGRC